ncbi:MAG: hypothetical protein HFJ38_06835 [Bacilli bacterium]|nr:hypothetical protein [Bacilli bacterium]
MYFYGDDESFVVESVPWNARGGSWYNSILSASFSYERTYGFAYWDAGSRLFSFILQCT